MIDLSLFPYARTRRWPWLSFLTAATRSPIAPSTCSRCFDDGRKGRSCLHTYTCRGEPLPGGAGRRPDDYVIGVCFGGGGCDLVMSCTPVCYGIGKIQGPIGSGDNRRVHMHDGAERLMSDRCGLLPDSIWLSGITAPHLFELVRRKNKSVAQELTNSAWIQSLRGEITTTT